MWQEEVFPKAPYNFRFVLNRLGVDPLVNYNLQSQELIVPLLIDNEKITVSVRGTGQIDRPSFLISSSYNHDKQKIVDRLSKIFQWDVSLEEIYNHFSGSSLYPLFISFKGTPLVCEFDLYRCLIKTIIHQQLNIRFAHQLTERFVKTYGSKVNSTWFYPDPEKVCALTYESLQQLQFSKRKAEYIIDTSKQIVEGKLKLEEFTHMSSQDVVEQLTKIRGIGPWTAQSFLLFGLGRKDQLPAADIGIQNAIKNLLGLDKKPTVEEVKTYAHSWAPYESYASVYLWESLGNQTVKNKEKNT